MRTEQQMIAYALEIDPQLLPYVSELLSDLEELGSDAEWITEVVAGLGITSDATVVDLGCGKGAVAVEIAEEMNLRVMGIDLFSPFIDSCIAAATKHGVSKLCQFQVGNVLTMAEVVGQFDLAICSALGDVLGKPDETVRVLREYVKPGGFLVISDVCLVDGGSNEFPGFEQYLGRDETISLLTASGDELVMEVAPTEHNDDDENDDEAEQIMQRAQKLALQHPELRDALMTFASDQGQENEFVEANFVDVIWVLRKA